MKYPNKIFNKNKTHLSKINVCVKSVEYYMHCAGFKSTNLLKTNISTLKNVLSYKNDYFGKDVRNLLKLVKLN